MMTVVRLFYRLWIRMVKSADKGNPLLSQTQTRTQTQTWTRATSPGTAALSRTSDMEASAKHYLVVIDLMCLTGIKRTREH